MDHYEMTTVDMFNDSWSWRIRPEPRTVPWCMEDVQPGWIQFKPAFTSFQKARWWIVRIDVDCIGICPTGGNLQLISYQELMDKCLHSTDLCNWTECCKKVE